MKQSIIALDLEGILVPEIWVSVAEETGIHELRRTTRDEPDYDKLMNTRIQILDKYNFSLSKIRDVIASIKPLDGAIEFLKTLRTLTQVIIVSDTFEQFAKPLMTQLDWPAILCHDLIIEKDRIVGYKMRQQNAKRNAIQAFKGMDYFVIAVGDSFNDTAMLAEANVGFLFRSPIHIQRQFPHFVNFESYSNLLRTIQTKIDDRIHETDKLFYNATAPTSFNKVYETSDIILNSIFERERFNPSRQWQKDALQSKTGIQSNTKLDDNDALDKVAEKIREFFNAESCGIFLIQWTDPTQEKAVVDWENPYGVYLAGLTQSQSGAQPRFMRPFKISEHERERHTVQLTKLLEEKKEYINLTKQQLDELNKDGDQHFKHLSSSRCSSLMAMPLFDHKNIFIGFFKVENKSFYGNNSEFMNSFRTTINLAIEIREFCDCLREVMQADHHELLDTILRKAALMLRADRADFAYKDSNGKLIYRNLYGRSHGIREEQEVPNGFIRDAWENKSVKKGVGWDSTNNSRWTWDIENYLECGGNYHKAHNETKNELAVRFGPDSNPIGVLNVEAFTVDRKFDRRDEEILQLLAQNAAVAIKTIVSREEEEKAREEEKAQTRLYVQLVNRLPQMMIVLKDKNSQFTFWNETFRQHLGKTEAEMKDLQSQGKLNDATFFPEEYADSYQANDKNVMYRGAGTLYKKVGNYEIWYKEWPKERNRMKGQDAKDDRIMHVTKIRMTNAQGHLEGVQCIFSDVTDRINSDVEHNRKVIHRVANNLNFIKMNMERGMDAVEVAIAHIDLVHKLLYGDPENITAIKLDEVLCKLVQDLLKASNKTSIHFKSNVTESISFDREKAQAVCEIVAELTTNAIKYAFPGIPEPEISLTISTQGDTVVLLFGDNGIGLGAHKSLRKGFGLRQVDNRATYLGGTAVPIDNRTGTIWQIQFQKWTP